MLFSQSLRTPDPMPPSSAQVTLYSLNFELQTKGRTKMGEIVKVLGSTDTATCARFENAGCVEKPGMTENKGKAHQGKAQRDRKGQGRAGQGGGG